MQRIVRIALSLFVLLSPVAALAQGGFADGVQKGVNTVGSPLGFGEQSPTLLEVVGVIISTLLTLVGVVLLMILIYAGFLWMTASGNLDQVKKARGMIMNAIIGLVIIFASYAIADFVLTQLIGGASGGVQDVAQ